MENTTILYVGGFQLPDKNAAALRVVGNAKALRKLGYNVVFLNALTDESGYEVREMKQVKYDEFICFEYQRELQKEYLFSCRKIINAISKCNAKIVIAYNHPSIALNKLRKYCQKNDIKCYADATEWYVPQTGSVFFRIAKSFDSEFRMRYVHPRMDGVIAISQYLFCYYKDKVKTVKIPPLVDISDKKWNMPEKKFHNEIRLLYAGSPSRQKEKLDIIVNTVEEIGRDSNIHLDVVGITKSQYNEVYGEMYCGVRTKFWGRVSNMKVIKMTMDSDWIVVLRDRNKVVQAGFPTKIVEAISCGTPVIANHFSNIDEYLNDTNSVLMNNLDEFKNVCKGLKRLENVERDIFDYRFYISKFEELLND